MELGDFLVGELFDLSQEQRLAPLWRQARQCVFHLVGEASVQDLRLEITTRLRHRLGAFSALDHFEALACASHPVEKDRSLDAKQPRAHAPLIAQIGSPLDRPDDRRLHQIFGVLLRARKPTGRAQEARELGEKPFDEEGADGRRHGSSRRGVEGLAAPTAMTQRAPRKVPGRKARTAAVELRIKRSKRLGATDSLSSLRVAKPSRCRYRTHRPRATRGIRPPAGEMLDLRAPRFDRSARQSKAEIGSGLEVATRAASIHSFRDGQDVTYGSCISHSSTPSCPAIGSPLR